MSINRVELALFFFFVLSVAIPDVSISQILKGSVNCLDCAHGFDLSGIQVLVKCDKVKKLAMTYTEEDGTFNTELPHDSIEPKSSNYYPSNCAAKIMGGPYQLYTSKKDSLIQINKGNEQDYYTTSKPLNFYKKCPLEGKCVGKDMGFGSSKSVDLPVPREWGLPPSSYYLPIMPIIGIP